MSDLAGKDILGRWRILGWEQRYDDGRVTHPMGRELEGWIQYDADGRMACMLGRLGRPGFTSGGQWNAPEPERAGAYNGFMAYSGRFSVAGNGNAEPDAQEGTITHHVDMSLFPNWVGGDQKRRARFAGGILSLAARLEDGTPEARTALLSWKRW
jgi:hypothetical protein